MPMNPTFTPRARMASAHAVSFLWSTIDESTSATSGCESVSFSVPRVQTTSCPARDRIAAM